MVAIVGPIPSPAILLSAKQGVVASMAVFPVEGFQRVVDEILEEIKKEKGGFAFHTLPNTSTFNSHIEGFIYLSSEENEWFSSEKTFRVVWNEDYLNSFGEGGTKEWLKRVIVVVKTLFAYGGDNIDIRCGDQVINFLVREKGVKVTPALQQLHYDKMMEMSLEEVEEYVMRLVVEGTF